MAFHWEYTQHFQTNPCVLILIPADPCCYYFIIGHSDPTSQFFSLVQTIVITCWTTKSCCSPIINPYPYASCMEYLPTFALIITQMYTGTRGSCTNFGTGMFSRMELRTPTWPKSHTNLSPQWNSDDFSGQNLF